MSAPVADALTSNVLPPLEAAVEAMVPPNVITASRGAWGAWKKTANVGAWLPSHRHALTSLRRKRLQSVRAKDKYSAAAAHHARLLAENEKLRRELAWMQQRFEALEAAHVALHALRCAGKASQLGVLC